MALVGIAKTLEHLRKRNKGIIMNLDLHVCSQARLARDVRFDGRFFIGVRTTRIYCRPICPVRSVKEENVRYFQSAAAAAEAGYRACLRCRPESAPGTPAWSGTLATVTRALRLISEGALEDASVEKLAARLGIGGRQLRRLFARHLGASPTAIMKTRRLGFAKKLIDETNLPFNGIAIAAGFGSVRRFNSEFRKTYKRTPTQLRKLAPAGSLLSSNQYRFDLRFRPPFQWDALLDYLAKNAIPGVEMIQSNSYQRTIAIDDCAGSISVSLKPGHPALQVDVSFTEPRLLFQIIGRLRRMFDLDVDGREVESHLSVDPLLARRIQGMAGLRVPGSWDGFELAVQTIINQHVSITETRVLMARLVRAFGKRISDTFPLTHLFPRPESLGDADLTQLGFTANCAGTIRSLTHKVLANQISFSGSQDPNEFRIRLREVTGLDAWSSEYIAMRALSDPDAFPANDRGPLVRRAQGWRPWRAYAAMYLWQGNSLQTNRLPRRHIDALSA